MDKTEQDRKWLRCNSFETIRPIDIEIFIENVASIQDKKGITEENARKEAFSMLGAVYQ